MRIAKIKDGGDLVVGVEYTLPTPEHAEGRLTAVWPVEAGGSATGPLKDEEMLQLRREDVHPTIALQKGKKGCWGLSSARPKVADDRRETPEEWWLPVDARGAQI